MEMILIIIYYFDINFLLMFDSIVIVDLFNIAQVQP
jgi:hypothetical protein